MVYIVEKSVANKLHLAIKVNDPSPITTEMVMKVCLMMMMMMIMLMMMVLMMMMIQDPKKK